MRDKTEIQIPFPGFYQSRFDGYGDIAAENEAYNRCEDGSNEGDESSYPEALRLDESDICDAFHGAMNWKAAHDALGRDYAAEFAEQAESLLGVKLKAEFAAIESPKFYNFETDRLFMKVDSAVLEFFHVKLKRDYADGFAAIVEKRHSSRSGFISFYNADASTWWAKPFAEWDINERSTLFLAALEWAFESSKSGVPCGYQTGMSAADWLESEAEAEVCESWSSNAGFDEHLNWPAYEADLAGRRARKLESMFAEDPAAALDTLGELAAGYPDGARAVFASVFERKESAALVKACADILASAGVDHV